MTRVNATDAHWPTLGDIPPPNAFRPEEDLPPGIPQPGVYLLLDLAGRVVYIGHSCDIRMRLDEHRGALPAFLLRFPGPPKDFHRAVWTPIARLHDRLQLETILISACLPPLNRIIAVAINPDGQLRAPEPEQARRVAATSARGRPGRRRLRGPKAAHRPPARRRLGPRS